MADYFDNDAICSRIQQFIEDQQLTAKAFAEKAGIPASTISNNLSGKTQITIPTLNKIIETYPDCNPRWLITGGDCYSMDDNDGNDLFAKPRENQKFEAELKSCQEKLTEQKNEIDRLKQELEYYEQMKTRSIDKILVFYSDNFTETYLQKK